MKLGSVAMAICLACSTLGSQTAAAQDAPQPVETVEYIVKARDTLTGLGQRYFSSPTAYLKVQKFNRIANPRYLRPGSVLRIPVDLLKAAPLEAQLVAFQGDVRIERGSTIIAPSVGLPVHQGTIVQTGQKGYVTMILSNGSRVTLPSNSRVRITHMRRFLLTNTTDFDFAVLNGRVETGVTPAKDRNSRFRLRTPIAVSAVRGTRFRVAYDEGQGKSLTEVTEGTVAVSGAAALAAPTLVEEGFGASTSADGKVGTELLLDAPAVLRPGKVQKEDTVSFVVQAVPSATGYRVQLAKDAGFIDMIAETRSDEPKAEFTSIDNGNLFVRAMAIAPSGLEGKTEVFGFRRQLAKLGGAAAPLAPGQYEFKWLGAGPEKKLYRFQLLSKPNGVPLIDEAGLEGQAVTVATLTPGVYYWRVAVRVFTPEGPVDNWTPPEKFTVSKPE